MIGITKLYLGTVEASDPLRYGRNSRQLPPGLLQFSADKKPVVVWNITSRCNLECRHCYASGGVRTERDLDHEESFKLIKDLADFGVPVLLFSGGEPLLRPDCLDLVRFASSQGLRCVLSSNGTLLDLPAAIKARNAGVSYVGISLDGLRETHDSFRGRRGSFDEAIRGIRSAREAGLKVGLRFTIAKDNMHEVRRIMDLLSEESIERICFYHLVPTGRSGADGLRGPTVAETRRLVDSIVDETVRLWNRGARPEVLTVDNHCDGPYLYLRMIREKNPRAESALELMRMNGGNSSGHGIACIGWDGSVYPDQFWRSKTLGNVREKSFRAIWKDRHNVFLAKLRQKKKHVTGRCAACRFLDVCGGNLRARAEALTGDAWASDPACYLTDEEINQ